MKSKLQRERGWYQQSSNQKLDDGGSKRTFSKRNFKRKSNVLLIIVFYGGYYWELVDQSTKFKTDCTLLRVKWEATCEVGCD